MTTQTITLKRRAYAPLLKQWQKEKNPPQCFYALTALEYYNSHGDNNPQRKFKLLKELNQAIRQYINQYPTSFQPEIQQILKYTQQGMTALVSTSTLQPEVAKILHFVWLGNLGEIQQNYINAWGETNGTPAEGYQIKIWYDPHALLVHELGKQIKNLAAVEHPSGGDEATDKIIQLKNQAQKAIRQAMTEGKTFDQAAANFMVTHLDTEAIALETIREKNHASYTDFINEASEVYKLEDIATLPDELIDKKYYYQELALRQNLAAASDILRLKILFQQGGFYFDADYLPALKPSLFNTDLSAEISRLSASSGNDKINLHFVKTQLVLEHLSTQFSGRQKLVDAGKYEDYVSHFAAQSAEHAALVAKMRAAIRATGSTLSDFFLPLGSQRLHPEGIRSGYINGITNAALSAHPKSAFLATLGAHITDNYHLLEQAALVDINNRRTLAEKAQHYQKLWEKRYQGKEEMGYRSFPSSITAIRYREDSIIADSRATIYITGPAALDQAIDIFRVNNFGSAEDNDDYLHQSLSPIIDTQFQQFNQYTEEESKHSWCGSTESHLKISFSAQLTQLQGKASKALDPRLYQTILTRLQEYNSENNSNPLSQQEYQRLQQINQAIRDYRTQHPASLSQAMHRLLHSVQLRSRDMIQNPALQTAVTKKLHFICLAKLNPGQQEHIKIWQEKHKDYQLNIWYDPDALLADALGKQIKCFAARDRFVNESAYLDAVIQQQNQAHQAISLAMNAGKTFDQAAIDFMQSHFGMSINDLNTIKTQNQASYADFINSAGTHYSLKNINTALPDKKYYYQELTLRQNLAAAAEILPFPILHQAGGAYFHTDLLPTVSLEQQQLHPDGILLANIHDSVSNKAIISHAGSEALVTVIKQIDDNYQRLADANLVNINSVDEINDSERLYVYNQQLTSDSREKGYELGSDYYAVYYRRDGATGENPVTTATSGSIALQQAMETFSVRLFGQPTNSDLTAAKYFAGDVFSQFSIATDARIEQGLSEARYSQRRALNHIISRTQLLQKFSVATKPNSLSSSILDLLDQFHTSSGKAQINCAFRLQDKIRDYQDKFPRDNPHPAFQELTKQLDQALFNDLMTADKAAIIKIAEKNRSAAVELYRLQFNAAQGYAPPVPSTRVLSQTEAELLQRLQQPIDEAVKTQALETEKNQGNRIKNAGSVDAAKTNAINWYISMAHQELNETLRNGSEIRGFVKQQAADLLAGIAQLEAYQGTVYGAFPYDNLVALADRLSPGQLVSEKGFLSVSSSAEFAKALYGGTGTVIYAIEGITHGRNIAGYTSAHQAGIVLPPGTHLRVKATQSTAQHLYLLFEQASVFKLGEPLRDLATGQLSGVAINNSSTTISQEVRASFSDITATKVLNQWHGQSTSPQHVIAPSAGYPAPASGASNNIPEISFSFSQGDHLLDKLFPLIQEVGEVLITSGDHAAAKEFKQGICLGLSARYLMEERKHGAGGGKQYIAWLQEAIKAYNNNKPFVGNTGEERQRDILRIYYRQHLAPVIRDLLLLQYDQYPAKLLKKSDEILRDNGLNGPQKSLSRFSKMGYETAMEQLRAANNNTYWLFTSQIHAMAVVVNQHQGQRVWSFFDPNYGAQSFNHYTDFRAYMDSFHSASQVAHYKYFPSQVASQRFNIEMNAFTERRINQLKSVSIWKTARDGEQDYIIRAMKEHGYSFNINQNVSAKVINFTLQNQIGRPQQRIVAVEVELTDRQGKRINVEQLETHFLRLAENITANIAQIMPHSVDITASLIRMRLNASTGTLSVINQVKSGLSDTISTVPDRDNVHQWYQPEVNALNNKEPTRFDSQIILQLENDRDSNDKTVMNAAARLAAKHPHTSVLVQADLQGNYRIIYGSPEQLVGNVRWQLVGHGSGNENGTDNQRLAGYKPSELAELIKVLNDEFRANYAITSDPNYISLVSCALASNNLETSYARQFALALDQQGIRVDIAARRVNTDVDEQGHKITQGNDGKWQYKISDDKVVYAWNKQGTLVAASALEVRLMRAIKTVDILARRQGTLESHIQGLDAQQRWDLADFFHTAEGYLDAWQLNLALSNDDHYLTWRDAAEQLLQVSDTHAQLSNLSGKQALERYQIGYAAQQEGVAALQLMAIQGQQALPAGVKISTEILPQALYIDDNANDAHTGAQALSLAWIGSRRPNDGSVNGFASSLLNHAMISERKAIGAVSALETQQAEDVRSAFATLRSRPTAGADFLNPSTLETAFDGSDGYYLLTHNHYRLAISSRTENGQHYLALYDPDVGVIRIESPDAAQNALALKKVFTDYLQGRQRPGSSQTRAQYRGISQVDGQWHFSVSQVDRAKLQTAFPQLITSFSRPIIATEADSPVRHQSQVSTRMHRVTDRVGKGMQAYGYFSSINHVIRAQQHIAALEKQLQQPGLSSADKATLEQQLQEAQSSSNWAATALGYNTASDITTYALQKGMAQFVGQSAVPTSRLGNMAFNSGSKMTRVTGPLLSIAGSFFDFREAYLAFSSLSSTTDTKIKQDLIVNGSLAAVGGALSVATSIAFLAGGTAAMAAGPIGVAAGVGLIAVGQLYAAVRQVEEIKKYIRLTPKQELRAGWLAFWSWAGIDQDAWIKQKLEQVQINQTNIEAYNKAKLVYRQEYDRQLAEQVEQLMSSNPSIDVVYYSRGHFELEAHFYKKLIGEKISAQTWPRETRKRITFIVIEDWIDPTIAEEKYQSYVDLEHYTWINLTDSDYQYYSPKAIQATNDKVISRGYQNDRDSDTVAVKWRSNSLIMADRVAPLEAYIAWFRLEAGDDEATGNTDRKNVFEVGRGMKKFQGGPHADTFLLMAPETRIKLRILNGATGDDTVIGSAKPKGGWGYGLNLARGIANYVKFSKKGDARTLIETGAIIQLSNIEHAQGHPETHDYLVGDQHDNHLNGAGGIDYLIGNAGNDWLTLAAGVADGGEGEDHYRILQNKQNINANVKIIETHTLKNSTVLLDYQKEKILAISLTGNDVMIRLANDNNSETHLTLQAVYRQNKLRDQFIFHTRDGYLIQLPITALPQQGGSLADQLTLYYDAELDRLWQQKAEDKTDEQIDAALARKRALKQTNIAGQPITLLQMAELKKLAQPDDSKKNQLITESIQGVISHRVQQNLVSAEIKTEHQQAKLSNILLDHKAEQILSLSLVDNDVIINLRNDNGSLMSLKLKDIYTISSDGQQKTLTDHYLLYSRDGVMLSGLPPILRKNSDGDWPFTPRLIAQYLPDLDRDWQQHTSGKTADEINNIRIHLQQNNRQGQITIGERTLILPTFMHLLLRGTRFNTVLEGDNEDNLLESAYANDRLSGKQGEDLYLIKNTLNRARTVVINNQDDTDAPKQDLIKLAGWLIEDIDLQKEASDLVLRHRRLPEQYPTLHISHYFTSEHYRHLLIMDDNGKLIAPEIDSKGALIAKPQQLTQGDHRLPGMNKGHWLYGTNENDEIEGSEKDDHLFGLGGNDQLRGGAGNDLLDGGEGDDILLGGTGNDRLFGGAGIDKLFGDAGDDRLYGGEGNDELSGGAGNDKLYGDTGNDTLSGGDGNNLFEGGEGDDHLLGETGDDIYLFARGDGQDVIDDRGGNDTLRFTSENITKDRLWFAQEGDNLKITINRQDLNDLNNLNESVTLKNYYTHSAYKIERIEAGGYFLSADNITQLVREMADFSSNQRVSSNTELQNIINRYWQLIQPSDHSSI